MASCWSNKNFSILIDPTPQTDRREVVFIFILKLNIKRNKIKVNRVLCSILVGAKMRRRQKKKPKVTKIFKTIWIALRSAFLSVRVFPCLAFYTLLCIRRERTVTFLGFLCTAFHQWYDLYNIEHLLLLSSHSEGEKPQLLQRIV